MLERVTCADEFSGSQTSMKGLIEIRLNPMCKFAMAEFETAPAVDLGLRELHCGQISLDLEFLGNLPEPVELE